jgi:phenylalanyl-tRNA synthetase beta chain
MPTITLNKNVFEKLVGKKLLEEVLKDRICMLGTSLERIEGNEMDVELFPNRPDMLSEQGFARAFSSFIGVKTGLRKYDVKKSGEKVVIDKSVKDVRPFTACAIVKNLKLDSDKIKEIINIQEKLHITYGRNRKKAAIGVYPLEKIKFPISFVGKDPKTVKFQPLGFDSKIDGLQILSKHPTGREYGHLLEGMKKFPFFIDANDKVLSMPPVINSYDAGKISESTTQVFIECSGFDFEVLNKCLNIIVTALADMGGEIYSIEVVDVDTKHSTPDLKPKEMKIDIDYCNKWLGLDLKEAEIKKLLEKMGYGYVNKKALVPAYRADVMHQVDLFEDIAIAYGYENFSEEIPNITTTGEENPFEVLKQRIANVLVGLGLIELNSYNMTSRDNQCKKMNINLDLIEMKNAVNIDYNVLRQWIIPTLLEVISKNRHNEFPQNIFDIGAVFRKGNTESGVEENHYLGVALCDNEVDYTKIKQILDNLMRMLGLEYSIEEIEHKSFITGRVGNVIVKGKKIAVMGEIHPQVLSNWDIVVPVSCFELNLGELFQIL